MNTFYLSFETLNIIQISFYLKWNIIYGKNIIREIKDIYYYCIAESHFIGLLLFLFEMEYIRLIKIKSKNYKIII